MGDSRNNMKHRPPQRGLTTEALITRVIDGDTVEVQPMLPVMRIRLLDCWAPETRTKNLDEKARGIESRMNLRRLLMEGQRVLVEIPGKQDLDETLTMGRVLGRIWTHDNAGNLQNVSELQVEAGHATATKGDK